MPVRITRVLLVGQPNVGKSSLLRALTGAQVEVSNYPGTTVDVLVARTVRGGVVYEFIDTPGVYNLYLSSLEEEVTERAILEASYDLVINVVDATALERSLLITVALAELGVPMVVALNFWEEAERRGIIIDTGRLERLLGVPVVRVNPTRRDGVEELWERLGEARRSSLVIRYDDHIEAAVREAMECVPVEARLSRRGLAVRLVEGDPLVCERYCCSRAREARERLHRAGHDPGLDIEVARAGTAAWVAMEATRLEQATPPGASRLDLLLAQRPLLGVAASLGLLAAMVAATIVAGGRVLDLLNSSIGPLVERLASLLEPHGFPGLALASTLRALYAQYAAALPYVFTFYLLLALLEDTGLLARMMIWLSWPVSKLGLHPKTVIPALLGMGCSVPAARATRVLPGLRQRLVAMAMLAFIPCSSRSTVIFAVAGRVTGPWAPLLVYLQGFLLAALVAWLVARTTGAEEEALLIEDIPPLRRPLASNLAAKAWAKLDDFIRVVTPLVVAGAVVYAALVYANVTPVVEAVLSPFAGLLRLPAAALPPVLYGFVQKDLVVSMLAASLGTADFAKVLTPRQALVFTMLNSYQVPCIIALGAMAGEIGWRRALLLLLALDSIGLMVAALYAWLPLPIH